MLTVVCWKWKSHPKYRSKFESEHVNILHNMVKRNLHIPHKFLCITDNSKGVNCETYPLWKEPDIHLDPSRPNCYRRLKAFSKEAKDFLGERILSIDLDCVIVGDITPLVDRDEDFICWGDTARNTAYNGGFWLLKAGTRTKVWDKLTTNAPKLTKNMVGSDQAWMSYILGPNEKIWTTKDGVFSYRIHLVGRVAGSRRKLIPLPPKAKIVFFHGNNDPWDKDIQACSPWIAQHYY